MISRRWGVAGWGLAIVAVGWWLFGDTVATYRPIASGDGGGGRTTLRFSHFGSYQDYELWRRVIDAFEREHPDVSVVQEYVPGWYGRYDSKIRQQILSGSLPEVAVMQVAPFRELAGHFADVGSVATGRLVAHGVSAFTVVVDGEPSLRGVPVAGGNLLIYLNPDCFERASEFHGRTIPLPSDDWTVEEFRAIARALTFDTNGDGQLDQFGLWLPRWVYYLPFVWSFGADVMVDGAWGLAGSEAEAAFAFYRVLANTHRVCPKPADVAQLIQDTGFLTGKVGICVNGPWFQPFLDETGLRDRYVVMDVPTGPGGRATRVTWDGLCVADGLPEGRRGVAISFVGFCLAERVQRMIAETGRSLPSLMSALASFDRGGTDVRRGKFVGALGYSRLQPMLPQFGRVDRAINRHLYRWINGSSEVTAADFLAGLAADEAVVEAFESIEAD